MDVSLLLLGNNFG